MGIKKVFVVADEASRMAMIIEAVMKSCTERQAAQRSALLDTIARARQQTKAMEVAFAQLPAGGGALEGRDRVASSPRLSMASPVSGKL